MFNYRLKKIKNILLLLSGMFFSFCGWADSGCGGASISVGVSNCVSTVAALVNSNCNDCIGLSIDWGDGSPPSSSTVHTYTAPGSYNITAGMGGCNVSTGIVIFPINPPMLLLTNQSACAPNKIDLSANGVHAGSTDVSTYTYWQDALATIPLASPIVSVSGVYYIQGFNPCFTSTTKPVTVTINPIPISAQAVTVCKPIVDLTAPPVITPSVAVTSINYYSDAGATIPVPNPTAVSGGTYYVSYTTVLGCVGVASVVVTTQPKPDITFTNNNACLGFATNYTATANIATGSIATWAWEFGGTGNAVNPTSNIQNASFTFTNCNSASLTATLIATSDKGCTDTVIKPITVYCLPTATFTINNVCERFVLPLTNNSNNGLGTTGALTYTWNFGANTSNVTSPSFTYNTAGIYTVQLNLTDVNTCTNTAQQTVTIYPTPSANFIVNDVCFASSTQFTNTSTFVVPVGFTDVIITNDWVYNYTNSYNANAITLNTSNTYGLGATLVKPIAVLIVTSNHGCSDTMRKAINVFTIPHIAYSATSPCFPNTLTVTNTSSIVVGANANAIQSMTLDYGNGLATTIINGTNISTPINYNYTASGNYTMQLTGISNHGCANSLTLAVVLHAKPVSLFSALPNEGCEPLCVQYTNQSTQLLQPINENIVSYNWNFDDYNAPNFDNVSTNQTPLHCYNNPTNTVQYHSPTLIVTTNMGCKDTLKKNNDITVYPMPVAAYTVVPEFGNVIVPLDHFTNQSIDYTKWYWNFGDGSAIDSTQVNPNHYYNSDNADTYYSWLIVANQYGCRDTANLPVVIKPEFVFYIPNAFSPNTDNINEVFTGMGIGILEYEMWIFDRWGEQIYYTDDIHRGWNGRKQGSTNDCKQDVYTWKVELKDVLGKKHNYVGHVTLLR